MTSPYNSPASSQLLEINLISAQDLFPVSKPTRSYAVIWLHPERKLTTRIDQDGDTNPTWNEKFVFRVNEEFLNAETSSIMIEIYATAWLRDILIGTVGVLISNLIPPTAPSPMRKSKLRSVALQIRRPSGRPQGILNVGVTLLDSAMRSMPLYSKLSASAVGYWDLMDDRKTQKSGRTNQTPRRQTPQRHNEEWSAYNNLLALQRSQSEKNDSTISDDHNCFCQGKQDSPFPLDDRGSEIGAPNDKIVNANGSLCSDVGPSPSVVAAAIAKGFHPVPAPAPPSYTSEGSVLKEWTENNSTEGMKTKIERWNSGVPAVYDHLDSYRMPNKTPKSKRVGRTPGRKPPSRRNGLFSCFGGALGCEFVITCGGGSKKSSTSRRHLTASELTYDDSYA